MKRIILIFILIVLYSIKIFAQVGKTVQNITLTDVNNKNKNIPYLNEKVFLLLYVDPDVQEITDPLTDAVNAKKYSSQKFGAVGVVNCKDSWFPNKVIINEVRKKQEKYPQSILLIDKSFTLKKSWALGDINDMAVIILVGKDGKIKYIHNIKDKNEGINIISAVLKKIDSEIK